MDNASPFSPSLFGANPTMDLMDYDSLTEETFGDFLEHHLPEIVKCITPHVFFDRLRSARYFSESDCQEIDCQYRYPTRRSRAREFCDVLRTKGLNAFKLFMEILEYEYPHVYLKITGKKARNPPADYERSQAGRLSRTFETIVKAGIDYQNLNNQKNDLFNQMEEMQKMLETAAKENEDLEREINVLQQFSSKNEQLLEKQGESDKEIGALKDENRQFMKLNIEYRDKVSHLQNRVEQLLIDRDDLEHELKEANMELARMNQTQDVLREQFEEERKKSCRLISMAARDKPKTSNANRQAQNVSTSITTKIEILQCDLDGEQEKNKELAENLKMTNDELVAQQILTQKLETDKLKLQRLYEQTQLFLKHAERKNDEYFKTIQELEKEKRKAEEDKILAQQKCWDISDQKQRIFVSRRNLEQKYERLQQNFELLKQSERGIQNAGYLLMNLPAYDESPPPYPHRPRLPGVNDGSRYAAGQGENMRMEYTYTSHDPFSQFQPYPPDPEFSNNPPEKLKLEQKASTLAAGLCIMDEENPYDNCMYTRVSTSLRPHRRVQRYYPKPELEMVKLRPKPTTDSVRVNISQSRKYKMQIKDPNLEYPEDDASDSEEDTVDYEDPTWKTAEDIDAMSSSDSSDVQSDTDVFSLHPGRFNNLYHRWFNVQGGNSGSVCDGDGNDLRTVKDDAMNLSMKNLYIRSHITWEDKSKDGSVPVKENDILFILDALPGYYRVSIVEPTTGHHMGGPATGLIPDFEQAKIFTRRPSAAAPQTPEPAGNRQGFSRRPAIRNRDFNPYTIVAPVKALMKLPVLLSGSAEIVEAILDVLDQNASSWAQVIRKPDMKNQHQSWHEMCSVHHHCILASDGINFSNECNKHRYIIIYIKLAQEHQQQTSGQCTPDFRDCTKTLTRRPSLHSDQLIVPSEKIADPDAMVSQLEERITGVQNNMFWMTISWKTVASQKIGS